MLIAAGQMRADGGDIHFAHDPAGALPITYWVESGVNTSSTRIWVRIDLGAAQTRSIYLLTGNLAATSQSTLATFDGPFSSTDQVMPASIGTRSNSQRGFSFSPNENILMTALGKREPDGTVRTVTLWDNGTQAIVAQSQVSSTAGVYGYEPIAEPLWLIGGDNYVLGLFQGQGERYYYDPSSQINSRITFGEARICNVACTPNSMPVVPIVGAPPQEDFQFGSPDIEFYARNRAPSDPEVSFDLPFALDLSVAPDIVTAGDTLTYTLRYTNTGIASAPSAMITNLLGSALTAGSAASAGPLLTLLSGANFGWQAADVPSGDGGVITITAATQLYAAGTVYSQSANVAGNDISAPANASAAVTILDVPVGTLTAQVVTQTEPHVTVPFTATVSAGTGVTYLWDFGDGTTASGRTVSHAYAASGVHTATVIATNSRGLRDAAISVEVIAAEVSPPGVGTVHLPLIMTRPE